jgi:hypothetical protein
VPTVQDALGVVGGFLAPIAGRIFYLLILPFAYLAGYLIEILRPLIANRPRDLQPFQFPQFAGEEELLRQMEQTRPYVFGAVELLIVAVAVLIGIFLFERMLRERSLDLPEGVSLEREHASGIGLGDTLRGLRPRRAARRRRPHDDGTPAGALRVLYWRFLALAEKRGAGWRETAETPSEHRDRIVGAQPSWRAATPIVNAFEDLRYGEIDPDASTVARARDALRTLEAPTRGS